MRSRFSEGFFSSIPTSSGVYFMRDGGGNILYVGKAKSLRHRLGSYRFAKPGQVGENIVELLEQVERIDWEEHPSEAHAFRRENELIHALTPPYNLADCWEEEYFFVGIREDSPGRWLFRLTSRELETRDGVYDYFGCFRHRRRVKSGYTALLRLLYAAFCSKPRFSFPSRITRSSPPYNYSFPIRLGTGLQEPMRDFFSGRSDRLLHLLLERLLENEALPVFVRPGLQEDLGIVREFYQSCILPNRRRARKPERKLSLFSHREMRKRIRASVWL